MEKEEVIQRYVCTYVSTAPFNNVKRAKESKILKQTKT